MSAMGDRGLQYRRHADAADRIAGLIEKIVFDEAVPPGPSGRSELVPTSNTVQPHAHAMAAPGMNAAAKVSASSTFLRTENKSIDCPFKTCR
jgi:hypothetical protein